MKRRGRPPYPDILTPREWEVLGLLREGLSNEEIAERLGITLRTAKFHVSEILSKLGVENREQAAAWTLEERPRARRWLAWTLIARVAGAVVVAAAVVGLGLLAWGVWRTDGTNGTSQSSSRDPVRIDSISPSSGTIGDEMVIRGSGFDTTENDIAFTQDGRETSFQSGVSSSDGRTLRFELHDTLGACAMSRLSRTQACPLVGLPLPVGDLEVAVHNQNGVSNNLPFRRESSRVEAARAAIYASPSMQELTELLDEFVRASYQPSSQTYLSSAGVGIHESDDGEVYVEVTVYGVGAAAIRDAIPREIAKYPVRIR